MKKRFTTEELQAGKGKIYEGLFVSLREYCDNEGIRFAITRKPSVNSPSIVIATVYMDIWGDDEHWEYVGEVWETNGKGDYSYVMRTVTEKLKDEYEYQAELEDEPDLYFLKNNSYNSVVAVYYTLDDRENPAEVRVISNNTVPQGDITEEEAKDFLRYEVEDTSSWEHVYAQLDDVLQDNTVVVYVANADWGIIR